MRSIFIVDDEHPIARMLAIILQQEGFKAIVFISPFDALDGIVGWGVLSGLWHLTRRIAHKG